MKILYKFASRSRPSKFFAGIENIKQLSANDNYEILCSLDDDDSTMTTAEVMNKISLLEKCTICWGHSKSKIDAINRDMDKSEEWDILVNFSDDMQFVKHGFDNHIRKAMQSDFPDLDGVLHFNDSTPAGDKLMTMSIMGRKYYERFNYIYHPDYISLWSDNEAGEVAKMLGKYKYYPEIIFRHNHPGWGLAAYDPQYISTEKYYAQDKITFDNRKANNFGI